MVDSKIKYYLKLLLGNIVILLILLLVVEIFLHFFLINTKNEKMLDFASLKQLEKRGLNTIYRPHRYLGYTLTPSYKKGKNRHNALGFRGDEITIPKKEDTYRIFCIGGSTTYTSHVKNYKKSYPYLLEENLKKEGLNVEVINAGVNSWTTHESLVNFQLRILDLEPDMIIIYHAINDVKNRMVFPFEKYTADNSGRRAPIMKYDKNWKEWIMRKSNILRVLCIKLNIIKSYKSISTIDPMEESYVGGEFAKQINAGTYPSDIFKQYSMEEILNNNKPKYYKKNIEYMIALAKAYNIDVALSTFAYSTQVKIKSKMKTKQKRFGKLFNEKEIINALKEHNEVIKQIASEQKIAYLDFDEKFSKRTNLFNDNVHLNEKGSAVKANIFSDFLMKHFFNKKDTSLN